jgi:hypothetical protein
VRGVGVRKESASAKKKTETDRVGASSTTRGIRGWRGRFGCPLRIGARVGALLDCVFCSQPLLFEFGSSRGSAGVALSLYSSL